MNLSLEERLLVPALLTGIVALLSFSFTFFVGGATRRVRIFGFCSMIFTAGTMYSMFWHEQLASIFGWKDAWIGLSILVGLGAGYLCWKLLARQALPDLQRSQETKTERWPINNCPK